MDIANSQKYCRECGKHLPLSEFTPSKRQEPGALCAPHSAEKSRRYLERRREEMGEEAYRKMMRDRVRASRKRRGSDSEKAYQKRRRRAVKRLIDNHRDEFAELIRQERYNDGLES